MTLKKIINKVKKLACVGLTILCLTGTSKAMEGKGTSDKPYEITNVSELRKLNKDDYHLSAHYVLNNDIDAYETSWNNGEGFEPIGNESNRFSGYFDGKGNKISSLYINRPDRDYVGLFGYVSGGEIKNLGLIDVNIKGKDGVGALVGANNGGDIINCYSTGDVDGHNYVGGLVGGNLGTMVSCYSNVNVNGNNYHIGGLVGENANNTIINCYAVGSVNGGWEVGGLIGLNYGSPYTSEYGIITNCYSIGKVNGSLNVGGLVGADIGLTQHNHCFWNIETSGQSTSAVGTPKTTLEMKLKSTFSAVDWDFGSIWDIIEDKTYPFLKENNHLINLAPRFYGVFAGESEDKHKFREDAEAIYNVISKYPNIKSSNLRIISPANLEAVILEFKGKMHPGDRFWLYYAGHGNFINDETEPEILNSPLVYEKSGEKINNGDEYLVFGPKDNRESLSDDSLTNLLNNPEMEQINKMLIFDCCGSGGLWGRKGNENDEGDLDKLKKIGLIASCGEEQFSFSYPEESDADLRGRGIFSCSLEEQLKLGDDGIALADTNRDGILSFVELKKSMKGYIIERSPGIIRASPWLDEYIEVEISDSNIPELYSDANDFNPNASLINNIQVGDLDGDIDVDFYDFAKFAFYWGRQDCNDPNWCNGANMDRRGNVDFLDLKLFHENWLGRFFIE